ncbi:MAG: nucleotidyltransferase domain-containing protein, partial [Candidatus Babeliales bacterium]
MTEQDKQKLIKIITKYLPKAQIYLFGSRARKDNSPRSDIDIAIDNKNKIDNLTLSNIREEIEESTIPFTVDIIDLNNISEDLKKQILKD